MTIYGLCTGDVSSYSKKPADTVVSFPQEEFEDLLDKLELKDLSLDPEERDDVMEHVKARMDGVVAASSKNVP
jgi:hypothetical protein